MVPEIVFDKRQLDDIRERLGDAEKQAPKLLARAIRRGLTRMNSQTTKAISKELGIKQKTTRQRIWKAWKKKSLRARIRVGKIGLPLIDLGAKQTKKRGVTVRMRGKRTAVEGAFIQRMPGGHDGVFKRKRESRFPIIEQRTKALATIAREAQIPEAVIMDGRVTIMKEIDRQVEQVLKRGKLATGGKN